MFVQTKMSEGSTLTVYALVRWRKTLRPVTWTCLGHIPFTVVEQGAGNGIVVSIPPSHFAFLQDVAGRYLNMLSKTVLHLCLDAHFHETPLFHVADEYRPTYGDSTSRTLTTARTEFVTQRGDARTVEGRGGQEADDFDMRVTSVVVTGPNTVDLSVSVNSGELTASLSKGDLNMLETEVSWTVDDVISDAIGVLSCTPYVITLEPNNVIFVLSRDATFPAHTPLHSVGSGLTAVPEDGIGSAVDLHAYQSEDTPRKSLGISPSTTDLHGSHVVTLRPQGSKRNVEFSAAPPAIKALNLDGWRTGSRRVGHGGTPYTSARPYDVTTGRTATSPTNTATQLSPELAALSSRRRPAPRFVSLANGKLQPVPTYVCPPGYELCLPTWCIGVVASTPSKMTVRQLRKRRLEAWEAAFTKVALLQTDSEKNGTAITSPSGAGCCFGQSQPIVHTWSMFFDHEALQLVVQHKPQRSPFFSLLSSSLTTKAAPSLDDAVYERFLDAGIVENIIRAEASLDVPSSMTASLAVSHLFRNTSAMLALYNVPKNSEWIRSLCSIDPVLVSKLNKSLVLDRISHGMPIQDLINAIGTQNTTRQARMSRTTRGSIILSNMKAPVLAQPESTHVEADGTASLGTQGGPPPSLASSIPGDTILASQLSSREYTEVCTFYCVVVPADTSEATRHAVVSELNCNFTLDIQTHTSYHGELRLMEALSCPDCFTDATTQLLKACARRVGRRSSIHGADMRAMAMSTSRLHTVAAASSIQLVLDVLIDTCMMHVKEALLSQLDVDKGPLMSGRDSISSPTSDKVTSDNAIAELVDTDLSVLKILYAVLNFAAACTNAALQQSDVTFQSQMGKAAKAIHALFAFCASTQLVSIPTSTLVGFHVQGQIVAERTQCQLGAFAQQLLIKRIVACSEKSTGGMPAGSPQRTHTHASSSFIDGAVTPGRYVSTSDRDSRGDSLSLLALQGMVYSVCSLCYIVVTSACVTEVLRCANAEGAASCLQALTQPIVAQNSNSELASLAPAWIQAAVSSKASAVGNESTHLDSFIFSSGSMSARDPPIPATSRSVSLLSPTPEAPHISTNLPPKPPIHSHARGGEGVTTSYDARVEAQPSRGSDTGARSARSVIKSPRFGLDGPTEEVNTAGCIIISMVAVLGCRFHKDVDLENLKAAAYVVCLTLIRAARLGLAAHWDVALASLKGEESTSTPPSKLQQQAADIIYDATSCLLTGSVNIGLSSASSPASTHKLAAVHADTVLDAIIESFDAFVGPRVAGASPSLTELVGRLSCISAACMLASTSPPCDEEISLPVRLALRLAQDHFIDKSISLVASLARVPRLPGLSDGLGLKFPLLPAQLKQPSATVDPGSRKTLLVCRLCLESITAVMLPAADALIPTDTATLSSPSVVAAIPVAQAWSTARVSALRLCARAAISWHRIFLWQQPTSAAAFELDPIRLQIMSALRIGQRDDIPGGVLMHMAVAHVLSAISTAPPFPPSKPISPLHLTNVSRVPHAEQEVTLFPSTVSPVGLPAFVQAMFLSKQLDIAKTVTLGVVLSSEAPPGVSLEPWQLAMQLLGLEAAIRLCGIGADARRSNPIEGERGVLKRHRDRVTDVHAMSDAIIGVALPRLLSRLLSLEARARETWLRQLEDTDTNNNPFSPAPLVEMSLHSAPNAAHTPKAMNLTMPAFSTATNLPSVAVDPTTGAPVAKKEKVIGMGMTPPSGMDGKALMFWSSSEEDSSDGEEEDVSVVRSSRHSSGTTDEGGHASGPHFTFNKLPAAVSKHSEMSSDDDSFDFRVPTPMGSASKSRMQSPKSGGDIFTIVRVPRTVVEESPPGKEPPASLVAPLSLLSGTEQSNKPSPFAFNKSPPALSSIKPNIPLRRPPTPTAVSTGSSRSTDQPLNLPGMVPDAVLSHLSSRSEGPQPLLSSLPLVSPLPTGPKTPKVLALPVLLSSPAAPSIVPSPKVAGISLPPSVTPKTQQTNVPRFGRFFESAHSVDGHTEGPVAVTTTAVVQVADSEANIGKEGTIESLSSPARALRFPPPPPKRLVLPSNGGSSPNDVVAAIVLPPKPLRLTPVAETEGFTGVLPTPTNAQLAAQGDGEGATPPVSTPSNVPQRSSSSGAGAEAAESPAFTLSPASEGLTSPHPSPLVTEAPPLVTPTLVSVGSFSVAKVGRGLKPLAISVPTASTPAAKEPHPLNSSGSTHSSTGTGGTGANGGTTPLATRAHLLQSPGGSRVPSLVLPQSTKKGKTTFSILKDAAASQKELTSGINSLDTSASARKRGSSIFDATKGDAGRQSSSRASLAFMLPQVDTAAGGSVPPSPGRGIPSVRGSRTPLLASAVPRHGSMNAEQLNATTFRLASTGGFSAALDAAAASAKANETKLSVRPKTEVAIRPLKSAASAFFPPMTKGTTSFLLDTGRIQEMLSEAGIPAHGWTEIDELKVSERTDTEGKDVKPVTYLVARASSLIYRDHQLHGIAIVTLISCLLRPDGAGFRPELVDRLPAVAITAAQLERAAREVGNMLDHSGSYEDHELDGFAGLSARGDPRASFSITALFSTAPAQPTRITTPLTSKDSISAMFGAAPPRLTSPLHSKESFDHKMLSDRPHSLEKSSPNLLSKSLTSMGMSFRGPLPEAVRNVQGAQPGLRRILTGVPVVRPASEVASMIVKRVHRLSASQRGGSSVGLEGVEGDSSVPITVRGASHVRSGRKDENGWDNLDSHPVYVLQCHLSHPGNMALVNIQVREQCEQRGKQHMRFLRLLSTEFFQPAHYDLRHHIASGAYGSVVAAVAAPESPAAILLTAQRNTRVNARNSVIGTAMRRRSVGVTPSGTGLPPLATNISAGSTGGGMVERGGERRGERTHRTSTSRASENTSRSGSSTSRPSLALPLTALALNAFGDETVPGEYAVAVKIVSFPDDPTERCIHAEVLPEVAIMEEITQLYTVQTPSRGKSSVSVPVMEGGPPAVTPADAVVEKKGGDVKSSREGKAGHEEDAMLQDALAFGCPAACLLDYGITASAAWLVMERCTTSLRAWRLDTCTSGSRLSIPHVKVCIDIFACVVHRLGQLHANGVTHYDVKCDNILLRTGFENILERNMALSSQSDSSYTRRWLHLLPSVCWADFGESVFNPGIPAAQAPMATGRGTECIKAPEVLLAARSSSNSGVNGAENSEGSTGEKCDIWSLGCLLFELITGSFLFQSDDWAQFFLTVTGAGFSAVVEMPTIDESPMHSAGTSPRTTARSGSDGETSVPRKPVITDSQLVILRATVGETAFPILSDLLTCTLERNPIRRMGMKQLQQAVHKAIAALDAVHE
jgi:serine/threonine protein kinase